MKDLKEFKIPKERICGQRVGQLIYNSIRMKKIMKESEVLDTLWEISNEELQELIDKCLEDF